MWLINPIARAILGHGAYKMISTSGQAIGSTPSSGSAAATVNGIFGAGDGLISNETGAGCVGVSYVGQDFGIPVEIRKIDYYSCNTANDFDSSSNKLQYSDDSSTWVDHSLLTVPSPGYGLNPVTYYLERSRKARYWRILCNATPNPGGNRWGCGELYMYLRT